jgi:hypothetical protein
MSVQPEDVPVAQPLAVEQPPQRKRLFEALYSVDEGLAAMYEGATRMIDDPGFPDCLSLGAHAMRELMEKLPRVFDVPAGQKFALRVRIDDLERTVEAVRKNSACSTSDGWKGEIDGPVAKLLEEVETLLADRARDWMSRGEAARELMKRLEPGHVRRTETLSKTEERAWTARRDYFESVAHHGHVYSSKKTDHSEFAEHIKGIEVLLLDKLRPPTAADFAEIDGLMAAFEGASDG